MRKVAKFGGTSLANADCIRQAAEIVLADPAIRNVIVSAAGKDKRECRLTDKKLTDVLICATKENKTQNLKLAYDVLSNICFELGVSSSFLKRDFENLERVFLTNSGDKLLAYVQSEGERITTKIFKQVLERQGRKVRIVWPEDFMILQGKHSKASLDRRTYDNRDSLRLNNGEIVLIPGFYGVNSLGEIMTFDRGGSDISQMVVAKLVRADEALNFTDVNGVYRVNPDEGIFTLEEIEVIIGDPIDLMSYFELREMNYVGASVLHYDATIPLIEEDIPLRIRNTFNYEHEGTLVCNSCEQQPDIVKGIAHKTSFHIFRINDLSMEDTVGYMNEVTGIFKDLGVSIDHSVTSMDTISLAIQEKEFNGTQPEHIVEEIRSRLNPYAVFHEPNKTLVCVVGEGMKHHPGVLARVSSAISREGINIEAVMQGSSERNIIFGVDGKDTRKAVRALYNEFF